MSCIKRRPKGAHNFTTPDGVDIAIYVYDDAPESYDYVTVAVRHFKAPPGVALTEAEKEIENHWGAVLCFHCKGECIPAVSCKPVKDRAVAMKNAETLTNIGKSMGWLPREEARPFAIPNPSEHDIETLANQALARWKQRGPAN